MNGGERSNLPPQMSAIIRPLGTLYLRRLYTDISEENPRVFRHLLDKGKPFESDPMTRWGSLRGIPDGWEYFAVEIEIERCQHTFDHGIHISLVNDYKCGWPLLNDR